MNAAITEIRYSYAKRIAAIKTAIASDKGGFVFAWDKYALGVRIVDGELRVVSVEDATVMRANDRRSFRNGADVPAVLISRMLALQSALATVTASLAYLEEKIAA